MGDDDGKAGGTSVSGADKKYARFRLAERPQRAPGTNAYFQDLKEQMGRSGGAGEVEEGAAGRVDDVAVGPAEPGDDAAGGSRVGGVGGGGLSVDESVSESATQPRPRRPRQRPAEVGAATSLPPAGDVREFEEFRRRWSHFLSGTLMKACEVVFENTVAVGKECYDTQNSQIRQALGKSKRQTFAVLKRLETMGFISREELKENNGFVGVRIWFHTTPISK